MNGFIRHATLCTCLGASLVALFGCVPAYRELADPCWPERYNYLARNSVRDTFNAQAANGHALDQTIWPEYFDGRNKLTDRGEERLRYLALRRPVPDPRVFLQRSGDNATDAARKEAVEAGFRRLNEMGVTPVAFEVELRLMSDINVRKSNRLEPSYQNPDVIHGVELVTPPQIQSK